MPQLPGVSRWNVWKCKPKIICQDNLSVLDSIFLLLFSKDARLPVQLQRAMAAEAEAAREARAKVIAAEGEQKASRALKEASEVIAESSSALQLRYLQVCIMYMGV